MIKNKNKTPFELIKYQYVDNPYSERIKFTVKPINQTGLYFINSFKMGSNKKTNFYMIQDVIYVKIMDCLLIEKRNNEYSFISNHKLHYNKHKIFNSDTVYSRTINNKQFKTLHNSVNLNFGINVNTYNDDDLSEGFDITLTASTINNLIL